MVAMFTQPPMYREINIGGVINITIELQKSLSNINDFSKNIACQNQLFLYLNW